MEHNRRKCKDVYDRTPNLFTKQEWDRLLSVSCNVAKSISHVLSTLSIALRISNAKVFCNFNVQLSKAASIFFYLLRLFAFLPLPFLQKRVRIPLFIHYRKCIFCEFKQHQDFEFGHPNPKNSVLSYLNRKQNKHERQPRKS